MNQEVLKSVIRQVALIAFGTTVGAKVLMWMGIDPTDLPKLIDLLIVMGGAGASAWALRTRRNKAIVKQAAAIVPVPSASQASVGITDPIAPKVP